MLTIPLKLNSCATAYVAADTDHGNLICLSFVFRHLNLSAVKDGFASAPHNLILTLSTTPRPNSTPIHLYYEFGIEYTLDPTYDPIDPIPPYDVIETHAIFSSLKHLIKSHFNLPTPSHFPVTLYFTLTYA